MMGSLRFDVNDPFVDFLNPDLNMFVRPMIRFFAVFRAAHFKETGSERKLRSKSLTTHRLASESASPSKAASNHHHLAAVLLRLTALRREFNAADEGQDCLGVSARQNLEVIPLQSFKDSDE
jgi:hypothetical protein